MGTLREDQYTYLFICHPIILKNEKCSEKVVEKISMVNNVFSKIVPFVRCGKIL
jgi:hypothetical protein